MLIFQSELYSLTSYKKKLMTFQNCSFLSYSRELHLNECSMLLHDEHELETYKRKAA